MAQTRLTEVLPARRKRKEPEPVESAVEAATTKPVVKRPVILKQANPKFKPLATLPATARPTPCVKGTVAKNSSILIIQEPWIDLILDGRKTLEIRGKPCKKERERIYLALSGGGGIILGSVEFVRCHGPLSSDEWASMAQQHCVGGGTLPYGRSTYAWEMRSPIKFAEPVQYAHKPGIVVWAKS
jgi:hypothetical protein